MPAIGRGEVAVELSKLFSGFASIEQLQAWFARALVGSVEFAAGDEAVVSAIMYLVEDDSISNDRRLRLLRPILQCLNGRLSNDAIVSLMPVLSIQERLCPLISKHSAGVVSRTSFLSFVSKARLSLIASQRLREAGGGELSYLCDRLHAADYEEVWRWLFSESKY